MPRKSTISPAQMARAKKAIAAGVSESEISRSWGMSRATLSRALREETRRGGRAAEGTRLENGQG